MYDLWLQETDIRCNYMLFVRAFIESEHEYSAGTHTGSYNGIRTTVAKDAVCPEVVILTSDAGGRWWSQQDVLHCSLL